jgi:hypothetical protein
MGDVQARYVHHQRMHWSSSKDFQQTPLYVADSCPSVLQLRHLLWATSKHNVYTTNEACIMHWSTLTETSTKVSRAGHWRSAIRCLTLVPNPLSMEPGPHSDFEAERTVPFPLRRTAPEERPVGSHCGSLCMLRISNVIAKTIAW